LVSWVIHRPTFDTNLRHIAYTCIVIYVVKEADGSIPRETVLQDYRVPLNLIERWGNAMGILNFSSYRIPFVVILLLFLYQNPRPVAA
jgi:hypothetical protein